MRPNVAHKNQVVIIKNVFVRLLKIFVARVVDVDVTKVAIAVAEVVAGFVELFVV